MKNNTWQTEAGKVLRRNGWRQKESKSNWTKYTLGRTSHKIFVFNTGGWQHWAGVNTLIEDGTGLNSLSSHIRDSRSKWVF